MDKVYEKSSDRLKLKKKKKNVYVQQYRPKCFPADAVQFMRSRAETTDSTHWVNSISVRRAKREWTSTRGSAED